MLSEDRIEKKYKCKIYSSFVVIILGLTLIIYGAANLPLKYPGQDEYHIVVEGRPYDENAEYQKLFAYQTTTAEFKFIISGLVITIIGFIILTRITWLKVKEYRTTMPINV